MRKRLWTRRGWGVAALAALALAAGPLSATTTAVAEEPGNPLPVFEYAGIITDKSTMIYNPTDEYIFPSVFHAGEHFDNPLGEWYLYFAPHDDPGGITMMYSDSLEGPWTEYEANPIIENEWQPHYGPVPHVSTPEAFWHPEEERLFLYFHGNNRTTRYATSDNGVDFEYGGIAVDSADGGQGTAETSYARVFEHPDPASRFSYAMFYMDNTPQDIRRIRVAESVDARTWEVREDPIVVPGVAEGQNVSSADLWEWDDRLYVIYHASSGKIHARETNAALTELGPTLDLHEATGVGDDTGRVAAPAIVSDGDETYLFYESGDRLGATIAYAKLDPDAVRDEEVPIGDDPTWEQCPGVGSDEFDGDSLDRETWPYLLRDADDRHVMEGGNLVIPTHRGGVDTAPLIQQDLPAGPWQATTELALSPTEPFQQAGLLLYRDGANYSKFDLVWGSFGLRLEQIWRQNGRDRNTGADSMPPSSSLGDAIWLRLTSDGALVTAEVSYDGRLFVPFGRSIPVDALGADRIGPYAIRGATAAPEIEAAFDWFRWTPTAAEADACAAAGDPDEETSAPGVAGLSSTSGWDDGLHDGDYDIAMNLWWGGNGSVFRLFENGVLIATESLELDTPAAQSVSIPITGRVDGQYVYTGELENSRGTTATGSVTVAVTDAAPGRPVLSADNWDGDGDFTLSANMWWGTNASSYRFFEDGIVVGAGTLEAASPSAQVTTLTLVGRSAGTREYRAEFVNAAGSTWSSAVPVTVD